MGINIIILVGEVGGGVGDEGVDRFIFCYLYALLDVVDMF